MSAPSPNDALARCHPTISFAFFVLVLGAAMLFVHPVLSPLTLAAAVGYSIVLNGERALRFLVIGMVPLLIAAALFNPLFSHAGVTTLFYLFDGNPVTLESILFGIGAAVMLVTVIVWFSCSNVVLTSDKIIYLFGRLIPALSLLFSMALRMVPRLKAQVRLIAAAQEGMGLGVRTGGPWHRLRAGLRIFSILITWALENSIEVADSMKARGFGLPGRTAFSLFRLDRRDRVLAAVLAVVAVVLALGFAARQTSMVFFPAIVVPRFGAGSVAVWVAYAALVCLPLVLNGIEEVRWRRIASRA